MPDYDFKCDRCEHITERSFKMSEVARRVRCEVCQDPQSVAVFAKRVFTVPVLNLNHWVPDYRHCNDGQKEAQAAGIFE